MASMAKRTLPQGPHTLSKGGAFSTTSLQCRQTFVGGYHTRSFLARRSLLLLAVRIHTQSTAGRERTNDGNVAAQTIYVQRVCEIGWPDFRGSSGPSLNPVAVHPVAPGAGRPFRY